MNSPNLKFLVAVTVGQVCLVSLGFATTVNREEQADAKRWVNAKFSGQVEAAPADNYLTVAGNRSSIQRNVRDGRPLRIFNTSYARGLFLDGAEVVTVHLASPAKTFEAVVGLDGSFAGCAYTSTTQVFQVKSWGPQLNLGWDVRRKDLSYDWMRRGVKQWRGVADNYFGDYYPLTAYDPSNHAWMAWQFDRPEVGQGMVQAFRRSKSRADSVQLELHGLDPDARYEIRNLDAAAIQTLTGRELMQRGLEISLPEKQGAAVLTYRRLEQQ